LGSVPVVLVVEDEEPLQEIVHDALKEGGFDLTMLPAEKP
jgi:DNA-binding response OmpR family regulator